MRTGFNPSKRNRNIGTSKQGFGQDNRMVVPNPGNLFSALDRIGKYVSERRSVSGIDMIFIVEDVRDGCLHPCTIDDVVVVLEQVPTSDWVGIKTIVFRQPTRKQALLDPAWGRLRYSGEVSTARKQIVAAGPMILLDAIESNCILDWSTGLALDDQVELDRLRADGHEVERVGNRYLVHVSADSARRTQLYRTLLHEIGHWFDWLEKVETPASHGEDFGTLVEHYFARPTAEREAFAHRYAEGVIGRLTSVGAIPIEPQA